MSKTINILTPQKVKIQFQIATSIERVFAFIIDVVIMGLLGLLGLFIAISILDTYNTGSDESYDARQTAEIIIIITACLSFAFYTLSQDIYFGGQTIGKRIIGIKIIKANGMHPSPSDYMIRWCFRWLELWSTWGLLAFFITLFNRDGQRIGDIMAGTVVIKIKPTYKFKLSDIIAIKTNTTYQPQFKEVVNFKEEEMILIKMLIERTAKQRNKAHLDALELAAKRVADVLELKTIPSENALHFLKQVLNDYIILSR